MPRFSLLVGATLWMAGLSWAQGPLPVGQHDVAWTNTTGNGSAVLLAHVSYPATVAGVDTPVMATGNGWPVIVFLHGYSLLGSAYQSLASAWAERGYVVVALDTAPFDWLLLRDDGIAAHHAVLDANVESGSLLAGALATDRMLIAGHSMGGGVSSMVLAANPGYRGGFALAPFDPTLAPVPNADQARLPFGIVVGDGDTITPPPFHASVMYEALGVSQGIKFLYWLDATCDHLNLVGLSGTVVDPIFQRSVAVSTGFFGHVVDSTSNGLEDCIGQTALAEPHLLSLTQRIGKPEAWSAGPVQIGASTNLAVAVEPGLGVMIASTPLAGSLATPFGELLVDPAYLTILSIGVVGTERRLDLALAVPNDPQLVGLTFAMQSFGTSVNEPMTFGSAVQLTVTQ